MDSAPNTQSVLAGFEASKEGLWGIYSEIEDQFGRDVALLIAREFGGGELYVPKKLKPGHRLIELLGAETAQRFVELFGGPIGVQLQLPTGPFLSRDHMRRHGIYLLKAGHSLNEVARSLGVSRSSVKNWKKRFVNQ